MNTTPTTQVRPATTLDSEVLWRWRNDPATRAASVTTDQVSWADHEAWFAAVLENPQRHVLVGETSGGEPVGMVRFDTQGAGIFTVSINMAPEARGRRLSVPLLESGREWLLAHTTVTEIVALIREDNIASLRAFKNASYTERSHREGFVTLVR